MATARTSIDVHDLTAIEVEVVELGTVDVDWTLTDRFLVVRCGGGVKLFFDTAAELVLWMSEIERQLCALHDSPIELRAPVEPS